MAIKLDPIKFSELPEVLVSDGEELIPIINNSGNAIIRTKNLPSKITVSSTAPSSPAVNALWVDVS